MKKNYIQHFIDNKHHIVLLAILALVFICIVIDEILGAIFFSGLIPFLLLGNWISLKSYLKNTNRNQNGSLKK